MNQYFEQAVDNIAHLGDTDVFPFPIDNHVLFDHRSQVVELLLETHAHLDDRKSAYPPNKEDALVFVGYTGYRKAASIDPLWNAYLLGLTLSIADRIEQERRTLPDGIVHSYRYLPDGDTHQLFADGGWQRYRDRSLELASEHEFVLVTDIADFYPRVYHHRLQNQLDRLKLGNDVPSRIMGILEDFSGNTSYGLPVGGPASRILSELLLHGPDRLLGDSGITFCRYSDDYHVFVDSREDE